jgi:hypothetical protein
MMADVSPMVRRTRAVGDQHPGQHGRDQPYRGDRRSDQEAAALAGLCRTRRLAGRSELARNAQGVA